MPLCHESQSVPQGLPPSYETVMASERAFLSKYTEACRSKRCCKHSPDGTESERQLCVANIPIESETVIMDLRNPRTHEINDLFAYRKCYKTTSTIMAILWNYTTALKKTRTRKMEIFAMNAGESGTLPTLIFIENEKLNYNFNFAEFLVLVKRITRMKPMTTSALRQHLHRSST